MFGEARSYEFGDFTLDSGGCQLLRNGAAVNLRPKVFQTLLFLVQRAGRLVTRDDLLVGVWADTNVGEEVLTHCVTEVRKALDDDPRQPRYVRTVACRGYTFIAEVGTIRATRTLSGQPTDATPAPPTAIAVLPFANISGDPENEYLCDGLAEEIINGLTKLPALRVVAHSSSFAFKGRDGDVREIGRQLGVGSLLEGSVRTSGDRLRIAAQLINTADGYHLWSEQYDRKAGDLFEIEDEISAAILDKLKVKLLAVRRPARRPTDSVEAYHLYLKGRAFWHGRFRGQLEKAIECFEKAVALDGQFAPAHTGLADCYGTLGVWGFAPPTVVFPRAQEWARRALEIDDTLAEAHAALAFVEAFYGWSWEAAERGFARSIDLNPGSALTHLWNGHLLSILGRFDEAFAEMRVAQGLDPLSPVVGANLGWTYTLAHQYDRALDELNAVLGFDPNNGLAHFYLGYALVGAGKLRDAVRSLEKAREVTGGMPWLAESIAWIQGLGGDERSVRAALAAAAHRTGRGYVPTSAAAMLHLGLDDDSATLDCLEKALAERDALMVWIPFMPAFDRLHGQPRFGALLRGLGLG
jgi:TolB-like protein/Flp pilus assembly protein TadD